ADDWPDIAIEVDGLFGALAMSEAEGKDKREQHANGATMRLNAVSLMSQIRHFPAVLSTGGWPFHYRLSKCAGQESQGLNRLKRGGWHAMGLAGPKPRQTGPYQAKTGFRLCKNRDGPFTSHIGDSVRAPRGLRSAGRAGGIAGKCLHAAR